METITQERVNSYARELSRAHFGVECDIPVVLVNKKWKTQNASFGFKRVDVFDYADGDDGVYREEIQPIEIRLSKPKCEEMGRNWTIDRIKHELVHWWLCVSGKPFADDTKEFVQEAIRIGAPISRTKKAMEAAVKYGKCRQCGCGNIYESVRKGYMDYLCYWCTEYVGCTKELFCKDGKFIGPYTELDAWMDHLKG